MKKRLLTSVTILFSALVFSGTALAESPVCGEAQDDSWMQLDAVQEKIETMGYTIEGMGVSEGNCYQVSGLNVQGQSVIAYIDPRTGEVVQEDVAQ